MFRNLYNCEEYFLGVTSGPNGPLILTDFLVPVSLNYIIDTSLVPFSGILLLLNCTEILLNSTLVSSIALLMFFFCFGKKLIFDYFCKKLIYGNFCTKSNHVRIFIEFFYLVFARYFS